LPTFGDFQVNQHPGTGQAATTLQSLLKGNNGVVQPSGAIPGRFWYYAGVQLCANTWCGPWATSTSDRRVAFGRGDSLKRARSARAGRWGRAGPW